MRFINFSGALPSPHIFSVPSIDPAASKFSQIDVQRITGIYPTSIREDQAFHNSGISTAESKDLFIVPTRFASVPRSIRALLMDAGLKSYRSSVQAIHDPMIATGASYNCMMAFRSGKPLAQNKTKKLSMINHAIYKVREARLVPSSDPARYQQVTVDSTGFMAVTGSAVSMAGSVGVSSSTYPITYSTGLSQDLTGSQMFDSQNCIALWIYAAGVYSYAQNTAAPTFEDVAEAGGTQSARIQATYVSSEPNESVNSLDQRFYSLDTGDQETLHPVEHETYIYKKIRLIKFGSPLKILYTAM